MHDLMSELKLPFFSCVQCTRRYRLAEEDAQLDQTFLRGRVALMRQAQQYYARLVAKGQLHFHSHIDCSQYDHVSHGAPAFVAEASEASELELAEEDAMEGNGAELDEAEVLDGGD